MSFPRFVAARDRLSHGSRPGFVYLITNPAFAGLVKVGCTSRTPGQRCAELNRDRNTGTPGRFQVAHSRWFPDCQSAEALAHQVMQEAWVDKEWFRCELEAAAAVIDEMESRPRPATIAAPSMADLLPEVVIEQVTRATRANRIAWHIGEIALAGLLVYALVH
jgi:hypothetical protein